MKGQWVAFAKTDAWSLYDVLGCDVWRRPTGKKKKYPGQLWSRFEREAISEEVRETVPEMAQASAEEGEHPEDEEPTVHGASSSGSKPSAGGAKARVASTGLTPDARNRSRSPRRQLYLLGKSSG